MRNRTLSLGYIAIAICALVLTWSQNLAYFNGAREPIGRFGALQSFLIDASANPAARSVTFDIALVLLACAYWMVFEGRRLRLRFVWAYVVLGLLVAISVSFPLFLAAREMKPRISPEIEGRPSLLDGVGLGLLTALVALICFLAGLPGGL